MLTLLFLSLPLFVGIYLESYICPRTNPSTNHLSPDAGKCTLFLFFCFVKLSSVISPILLLFVSEDGVRLR